MLDLLLRLLDNIKQLIELRNKRQDVILEKLIEPTFNELQLIHQDYIETLRRLFTLLPSNKDNKRACRQKLKKALDYMVARSSKLEPVRDKLRAYENLHGDRMRGSRLQRIRGTNKITDLDWFLMAVFDYLSRSVLGEYVSTLSAAGQSSVYRTWIECLSMHLDRLGEPSRKTGLRLLQSDCVSSEEEMRTRWSEVSAIYAKIKVQNVTR